MSLSNTEHLTYHPDSPYFGASGYYGSLNSDQLDSLQRLSESLQHILTDLTDLSLNALSETLVLLRYLRANNFDVEKAHDHVVTNIKWRADNNIKELISMQPNEILGFDVMDIMPIAPHWQQGFDKCGRPIIYKHYGSTFDATVIKNMSSLQHLERYHVWEMEACESTNSPKHMYLTRIILNN
jgi:hypothetical protein